VWRLIIERQAAEAAEATARSKYTNKSKERTILQRDRESSEEGGRREGEELLLLLLQSV
jgi:hypothetical protein